MLTEEEVRDLLAPRVLGAGEQGLGSELDVVDLQVVVEGRAFTVYAEVVAPDGRWSVAVKLGSSEMNIFNGRPPEDLVAWVARLLRILLDEWWHTKGRERRSAAMGVRLD
ncbi:hypothetical protein [Streptomyces sp. NPDC059063]|uniref:hypothetical protein n=1 Tax=unclassified Streptomyces TaxID=2593676 RepID=UPI00367EE9BA